MCVLMCFFHGNEHVVICNRNENYTTLPIGIDLRERCFFVDIHVHVRTLRALWLDHNKRQSQWSDAKSWLIIRGYSCVRFKEFEIYPHVHRSFLYCMPFR